VTRPIVPNRARLEIFKPDNEPDDPASPEASRTPDIEIGPATGTASHIKEATMPRTLGPLKDQGIFTVNNRLGRYRRGDQKITSGDEVVFSVEFVDDPGVWHERFRGVVRKPKVTGDGAGRSRLKWKCEDFVGTILGWRNLEAGYKNRRIAGSSDAVLESALEEKCPEIARDTISADASQTTRQFKGVKMLKVVQTLQALADGAAVRSDARSLVFEPLSDITVGWSLQADDFGTFGCETDDGELANALRIDGAISQAAQDTQETQTGWVTVTKSSRITRQLNVPKSEVSSVEIWTDPTRTGSGDNIRVRLQKDAGGEPINPADSSLDHVADTNNGILEHDGWTTFGMPDNDILDDDPWLIIEATEDGDGSGQDIGVNAAGVPAYRAYYPFPISGREKDTDSIDSHRRRELQRSDTSVKSLNALGQELTAQLEHQNTISQEFNFDARSLRAHQLSPGDAIWIDSPTAGVADDFVVTKREETYDDAELSTDVRVNNIESL